MEFSWFIRKINLDNSENHYFFLGDTFITSSVSTLKSLCKALNLIRLASLPVSRKNFPSRKRSSGADISTTGHSILDLVQRTVLTSARISKKLSSRPRGSVYVSLSSGSSSDSRDEPRDSLKAGDGWEEENVTRRLGMGNNGNDNICCRNLR